MKKLLIIFCVLFLFLTGCKQEQIDSYSETGFYFDTVITISIYDRDINGEALINECFKMCKDFQVKIDKNNVESDIYKINTSKGKAVNISETTYSLIEKSFYYSELSKGKFDISIGSLVDLWDINNNNKVPPIKSITKCLKTIGYKNILLLENNTIKLSNPDAKLDLGGLAKGYVGDLLKQYLLDNGVKSAIIDLGGNIILVGSKNADPSPCDFKVGIGKPFGETNQYIATIQASNKSIVTSGIYQRYFESNGKIYHHILDPKTGYPVNNNLFSVTIISDKSVDGDGLSTSIFSLGLKEGLSTINQLQNIEAIFVTSENEIIVSDGLNIDNDNLITIK